MKTSKQLIEERSTVTARIAELSGLESLNEAQQTELRTAMQNEERLNGEVELALSLEKRNAEQAAKEARNAATNGKDNGLKPEEKEMRKFSFGKMLQEGNKVSGLEKELIDESSKEARALGMTTTGLYLSNELLSSVIAPIMEKRTMTAASGSGGGYLIPTIKLDWFDALFAYSIMEKAGFTKLSGLSANTDIPGIGTAIATGWADGETGTQTPADPTLVNRSLTPKLLYGATNVSKRLLIQTNQSVEAMILTDIMKGMAQALQAAVINGAGSSGVPTGILGTSGIQSVAMDTNGAAISFAKTMDLFKAVANANANLDNCKWITNPKVFAEAMQTPIDSGSGAMIIPYNSFFGGAKGQIAGYDVLSTSSVPSDLTKGSSSSICSALLFGDFSQVVVGQFGGIDIVVDDATNARTGTRAITINQYNDVVVKQPGAIGAIKDILAN
jgi:HK97 family phage major capsid protein